MSNVGPPIKMFALEAVTGHYGERNNGFAKF